MAKPMKNKKNKTEPVAVQPKKKFKIKNLLKKTVIWLIIVSFVLTGVLTGLAGMGAF